MHARRLARVALIIAALLQPALADDLACVSTTFRFLGANDKVCVSGFDDPKVAGVACHVSQARTGGGQGYSGLGGGPVAVFDRVSPSGPDKR
jgi:catabolite regulation protein CreA